MVIRESGDLKEALKHLENNQNHIVDKLTLKETFGELFLLLSQHSRAAKCYDDLIKRNPENTGYYKKMIEAKQITSPEDILNFYKEYKEKYPRSMPPKRLPLVYASGEEVSKTQIFNYDNGFNASNLC